MTPENRYHFARDYTAQQLGAVLEAVADWRASTGRQRIIDARWGLQCFGRWHHARASERAAFDRMIQAQRAGLFTRVLAAE